MRSIMGQSLSRGLMALAFVFTMASAAGAVSLFPNVNVNDPPDLSYGLLDTFLNPATGQFESNSVFATIAQFRDNNNPADFPNAVFNASASGVGTSVFGDFSAKDGSGNSLLDGTLIAFAIDTTTFQYLATITGGLLADEYGGIGSTAVLNFGGFGMVPTGGVFDSPMMGGTVDILGATVIPVPAALPLLLTAFGGLFFLARRRRTAQAV